MNDLFREYASYPELMGKLIRHKNIITPKKVCFGRNSAQYFLHFAPSVPKCGKVVFYVHGGGWNSGSPSVFKFIGQRFAQEGYHCILLGYRRTPFYRFPSQIEDVCAGYKAALRYLKSRGINVPKSVVVGSSAGAHLGALLCYDSEMQKKFKITPNRLGGFIGLAGPYRFENAAENRTLKILMNDLFKKDCERSTGEPYSKLEAGQNVPMLLIHSKHDGLVSYQNAEDFSSHAQEMGISAELYEVKYGSNTHSAYSAGIFLDERNECETLNIVLEYIDKI